MSAGILLIVLLGCCPCISVCCCCLLSYVEGKSEGFEIEAVTQSKDVLKFLQLFIAFLFTLTIGILFTRHQ